MIDAWTPAQILVPLRRGWTLRLTQGGPDEVRAALLVGKSRTASIFAFAPLARCRTEGHDEHDGYPPSVWIGGASFDAPERELPRIDAFFAACRAGAIDPEDLP